MKSLIVYLNEAARPETAAKNTVKKIFGQSAVKSVSVKGNVIEATVNQKRAGKIFSVSMIEELKAMGIDTLKLNGELWFEVSGNAFENFNVEFDNCWCEMRFLDSARGNIKLNNFNILNHGSDEVILTFVGPKQVDIIGSTIDAKKVAVQYSNCESFNVRSSSFPKCTEFAGFPVPSVDELGLGTEEYKGRIYYSEQFTTDTEKIDPLKVMGISSRMFPALELITAYTPNTSSSIAFRKNNPGNLNWVSTSKYASKWFGGWLR